MALEGLTVVDIASLGAAPQIAAFFGDYGARVIKVEPPSGDPLRLLVDADGIALQWKIVNRNKRCVTIDLNREEGRSLLHRMLERADVLVAAHSHQRLERWGLDAMALSERHPQLVCVNLTTYGIRGPWAARPGSGTLAEAVSGLAALTGSAEGPPGLSPVGLGDYLGVLQGVIAALVGLYQRDARGPGETEPTATSAAAILAAMPANATPASTAPVQPRSGDFFDVAMVEPLLALLGHRLAAVARTGVEPVRQGNRFPTMAPRNTYRTADGKWVALTAGTEDLVKRTFELIGRPELTGDPRFRTNLDRVRNADALDSILGSWIGAKPRAEVERAFLSARVSLAPVDAIADVLANPHFRERGLIREVADPDSAGSLMLPAGSPSGQRTRATLNSLGGGLGVDNRAIYCDWLGLTAAELVLLEAGKVV